MRYILAANLEIQVLDDGMVRARRKDRTKVTDNDRIMAKLLAEDAVLTGDDLVTLPEAAMRLKVPLLTISNIIRDHKLPLYGSDFSVPGLVSFTDILIVTKVETRV